jgi:hypothetical protein
MAMILRAQPASAYKPDVHSYIAGEALELYCPEDLDLDCDDSSLRCELLYGAEHEDHHNHLSGVALLGSQCLSHFWDADLGRDFPVWMGILFDINAWQKAETLWGMALGEYASGDKDAAYEYLGHVAHLLADQSVPAHAHEDFHLPIIDDDCYEEWMTTSNAALTHTEKVDLLAAGPATIPDPDEPLYSLFYTTNQIGDFFASDNSNGDTIDNESPAVMNDLHAQLGMEDIDSPRTAWDLLDNDLGGDNFDGDLGRIREYSFKYAIRATAALYEHFSSAAGKGHTPTVQMERVTALDLWQPARAASASRPVPETYEPLVHAGPFPVCCSRPQ